MINISNTTSTTLCNVVNHITKYIYPIGLRGIGRSVAQKPHSITWLITLESPINTLANVV